MSMDEEVLDSRGRNITLVVFGVIALLIIGLVWKNYYTKASWIRDMKSDNPTAQKQAAEAMMQRGQIAEQLQGQKPSVRIAAVRSLAQVRTPEAADQLFQFMKDSDTPIKDLTVRSIIDFGPDIVMNLADTKKDALHPGLDALGNSDDAVRKGAIDVLVSFGDVVLKPVSEKLIVGDSRKSAADVLVNLGKRKNDDPMKVLSLVVPYRDPMHPSNKVNEDVQTTVVGILDGIPDVRGVPYLIEMLQYPHTQRAAVGALGRKGDLRATPALLGVLDQKDPKLQQVSELIKEETVVALGQLKDPRAVPKLVSLLGSYSEKVRRASSEALQQIGTPSLPALLAAAKAPDATMRIGAARALGGITDEAGQARGATVALLNDPSADVRLAAATALGQAPNAQTVPALIAKFEDVDGRIGDAAADTLTRIGKPAVPALINALQAGPGSSKVYYASRALRFIGQTAVPALTQALRAANPAVARWSARLLGDMGDTDALPALRLAAQNSTSPEVRWAASRSAERLGGTIGDGASS
jgi:HEAT repeat protein